MHLVINASEVGRQRGGNETFIAGLIEGLAALPTHNQVSLLRCQWETAVDFPPEFDQLDLGAYRRLPFFLWQQSRALRKLAADWYIANFFLPFDLPCQGCVAVHDLSFRAHPDYFPRSVAWYMRWLTGLSIRKASRVLTISEFSRRELLRFYNVDPRKVVVVPLAAGSAFRLEKDESQETETLARYNLQPPYILAVGNIHPRKNLARLLDAYLLLREKQPACPPMVWVGVERWDSGQLMDRARAAGILLPGFIAQEHLPTLYRQALMLVYPSLYEGFGLPTLEAMACGTPVITSSTSSLPEVVGEAALLVDPTDAAAMADSMQQLVTDQSLREQLKGAGIEQARKYSWARTAQQILATLDPAGI